MIYGNKEGIKDSLLNVLESFYDLEIPSGVFIPEDLARAMAVCSSAINREISVYISRTGSVMDVSVGDLNTVGLRDIHLRRNAARLSMVRCIHTHPSGNPSLSDVDLSSLRSMHFDAMAAIGVADGKVTGIQAAFLTGEQGEEFKVSKIYAGDRIPQQRWTDEIEAADQAWCGRKASGFVTEEEKERCYLVGLGDEESLQELGRLAETAGGTVVGQMLQNKAKPETATYIGSGKLNELSLCCQTASADIVIFDDELSGVQLRNLEASLGSVRVLDRTSLILDIFAQRAQTREGVLQVELAQLAYQLPRLTGHGISMSRLGGGIGTRGPGETQLEMDRRRIHKRIFDLKQQIDQVGNQRTLRRSKRQKSKVPVVALVGYTNAGKTTLLNRLSGANAEAADKLFATLDPLSRLVSVPGQKDFVLVDTVGFIRKLPHTLVDAFRSTLEETLQADILLIVSDGSSSELLKQHDVVLTVLKELGADDKVQIDVVNKMDQAPESVYSLLPNAIPISAREGTGMDELLQAIEDKLKKSSRLLKIRVPYSSGAVSSLVYAEGQVQSAEYLEDATEFVLEANSELAGKLVKLIGEENIICLSDQEKEA